MNENTHHVYHTYVASVDELLKMQGSKYVQSDMRNIFKDIQCFLEEGKYVLFSGTPCQVAAVKASVSQVLQSKLFCIDLICHGVPAPLFWEKTCKYYETKYKGPIHNISFRQKSKFEKNEFSLSFDVKNGNAKKIRWYKDLYFSLFLKGMCFSNECYKCQYACKERVGDITIGDCATAQNYDFNVDKAVSIILVNTQKGSQIWNEGSKGFEKA